MKKTLINGYGNSYKSKIISSKTTVDINFLWKHNFKHLDYLTLKNEKENYKKNALRSKASKHEFKLWKKYTYVFSKVFLHQKHSIQKLLISKNLLKIDPIDKKPEIEIASIAKTNYESFLELGSKNLLLTKNIVKKEQKNKFLKKPLNSTEFNDVMKSFKENANAIIIN